jgi:hypothetical protein
MADEIAIMISAVIPAVAVTMFSAGPISPSLIAIPPEGPRAVVLAADWCLADRRRVRHTHTEGLHLFCHGLLGACGSDQPARQESR